MDCSDLSLRTRRNCRIKAMPTNDSSNRFWEFLVSNSLTVIGIILLAMLTPKANIETETGQGSTLYRNCNRMIESMPFHASQPVILADHKGSSKALK